MQPLRHQLSALIGDAFESCGYAREFGEVSVSDRPDLCQFQCNGALAAAKTYKKNPREIAQQVISSLAPKGVLRDVDLAGPGFINLTVDDDFLTQHLADLTADERLGCPKAALPQKIVLDYGGPNVAKPLHVGHLRSAIIGESLKRIFRFLDHEVIADVHLGDWGLQMGMLLCEMQRRDSGLPYFEPGDHSPYPTEAPIGLDDLEEMYPAASSRAKEDPVAMEAAREATRELQDGHPGYRALWKHFVDVSIAQLRLDYAKLDVSFDLWLGESDSHERIGPLLDRLTVEGHATESEGALVVHVSEPDDKREVPPLILRKTDGAVLYGTTDLATIDQRVADYAPHIIMYVVDNRQSDHFLQVFRGAYKTGVSPAATKLEFAGFGTMNGKDGKPFKTREGGVMRLQELIRMVEEKATERMDEINVAKEIEGAERLDIASKVGLAALKYADLSNYRGKDYVFDLERFSSFEGKTGPYLLYSTVRARSILRTALDQSLSPGTVRAPPSDIERDLVLALTRLPDALNDAYQTRAPHHLAEYAYELAAAFNRFYHDHHILREEDALTQASWLALVETTARALECCLHLLGIDVPERM